MSKEECMDALSKYADIKPVITSTVWKELEKENKEFFEAYAKRREERGAAAASSETHRSQRIHDLLFHSNSNKDHNTSTTIN
ncbi:argininosuccinate lyase [Perilla frutescens var. hirtella]|uniref:Argininosuccinate lyase n=1 Tax=Perilla frutescens var. hirtella TaxID=608512 RepID=A0AAD4J3Q0_PERFH|nr:argininosuccinate lyase [Perilla frutescens var. hirtella]